MPCEGAGYNDRGECRRRNCGAPGIDPERRPYCALHQASYEWALAILPWRSLGNDGWAPWRWGPAIAA